jgi:general secretion pathway protein C
MFQINTTNRFGWSSALAALTWAMAAGGVVYWGLLLTAPAALPVVGLASAPMAPSQSVPTVAKVLGHATSVPQASTPSSVQFQLVGVIASTTGQGSALIAVGGQPPKAYRVGQEVSEGVKLVSLAPKQARLQSNGQDLLLDLPVQNNP